MTPGHRVIKVAVHVMITVDRDAWDAEYGTRESTADVRQSVEAAAVDAIVSAFTNLPVDVSHRIER